MARKREAPAGLLRAGLAKMSGERRASRSGGGVVVSVSEEASGAASTSAVEGQGTRWHGVVSGVLLLELFGEGRSMGGGVEERRRRISSPEPSPSKGRMLLMLPPCLRKAAQAAAQAVCELAAAKPLPPLGCAALLFPGAGRECTRGGVALAALQAPWDTIHGWLATSDVLNRQSGSTCSKPEMRALACSLTLCGFSSGKVKRPIDDCASNVLFL